MNMQKSTWISVGAALVALAMGCDNKQGTGASPAGSSSAAAPATASASASPSASAAPSAAASAAPQGPAPWEGTYKSAESDCYVPSDAPNGKDWKGVKCASDPAKAALGTGDGSLKVSVESDGRVTGELEGPLGPAVVSGAVTDGQLSATFYPKTRSPGGFTGTLVGKSDPSKIEGTIRASLPNADAIRSGTFAIAKK